jgi:hypothetical protein
MAVPHNTTCDKMRKFDLDSTPQQTISSHAICPVDLDIKYIVLNITDNNVYCLSYLFKYIF